MTRRLGAESLLDLAQEVVREEIASAVPGDKRYLAAMLANALDIARREISGEAEAAGFALLDDVYDDGDGTMHRLARDIRAGKVGDATHADLRRRLKDVLVAELGVRNPRYLKARGVKR